LAQAQKIQPAAENDPRAKAIFEKLKKKYNSKTLEVDFRLTIEVPESEKVVETGKLSQQSPQYRLELNKQTMICDGKTLWLHLKSKNEVQINTVDDADDSFLSPDKLLRIYERRDFAYILAGEYVNQKRTLQQIEMKPLDRSADYSKVRVEVDKTTSDLVSIKAFMKDGSRYTVDVSRVSAGKTFPAGYFSFNPKNYPGIRVEDLRLD
jgi:outer membrane lipoprotein-sorting protein